MSRREIYLANLANAADADVSVDDVQPRTREEIMLAYLCGCEGISEADLPEPRTRDEIYLRNMCHGGKYTPVTEKEVNFYDYDGTLLYSYTLEEAQALTELPPIPTKHEHLVPVRWLWTLDEIKNENDFLDIAPLYKTVDEATWFWVENDTDKPVDVDFVWQQSDESAVSIEVVGQGTETPTGTGTIVVTKTMPVGKTIVKLHSNGKPYVLGGGTSANVAFGGANYGNRCLLKELNIGSSAVVSDFAFASCVGLRKISFSSILASGNSYRFTRCTSLKIGIYATTKAHADYYKASSVEKVCFTPTTILGESAIQDTIVTRLNIPGYVNGTLHCYNAFVLKKVKLSKEMTTIATNMFSGCFSITDIFIPENITTINAGAFYSCSCMRLMRFNGLTPPTVANASAFTGIPTTCVVEVPAESLETYKNATNYASLAAQMVEV